MTAAICPPDRTTTDERARLRAAAFRVTRLYPGPVGELVSRELLTWEEFGYRLGGGRLVMRLVEHVLTAPTPEEVRATAVAQIPEAATPSRSTPEPSAPVSVDAGHPEEATLSERSSAESVQEAPKPHVRLSVPPPTRYGGYGVAGHPQQATASEVHR